MLPLLARAERDARRFTVSHGILRWVLGQYVGRDPATIRYGGQKPSLVGESGPHPIHFNMSHSGEMVVIGVAGAPLGVDVECLNRRLDAESIARRFFSQIGRAHV